MAEIKTTPAPNQWTELTFPNAKIYRWIEYLAPSGSYGRVAKVEFYSGEHKLIGDIIGSFPTSGARLALDGKTPTANVFFLGNQPDGQRIGLDLGDAASGRRPVINPGSGEFGNPITVTLISKEPKETIRYTTDGTIPTAGSGQIYSGPIHIEKTTTICAAAFQEGKAPTPPVDATYIIGPAVHLSTLHVGNSLTEVTSYFPRQAETAGCKVDRHSLIISGAYTKRLWNAAIEMIHLGISTEKVHWVDYGKTPPANSPATMEDGKAAWKKLWPSATQVDDFTLQPRDFDIAEEADYDNRFLNWVLQVSPNVQPWLYIEWDESARKRPTDLGKEPTSEMKKVWPAATWEESMGAMILYGEDLERKINESYHGAKPLRIIPSALAMGWIHYMIENGEVPGVAKTDFYQELFKDSVHTNAEGSYLVDCTWYAAFRGESPEGKFLPIRTHLTHEQAQLMQRLAWNVVKNYPGSGYYEEGKDPVGKPEFDPAATAIKDITPVMLKSSTPGAWFRYTLDGTQPSRTNGYIYCGVVSLRPGMTIKAIAYKSGMADSGVAESTYSGSPAASVQ
ncbi:MAG TPA: chitobiase/beta-hexosaminidase C-terminal domain-containing protein [Chthoniobacteraceae bacterium]|nr:chitobiase/beta-hexosaminidase C-terminal domain-containing protein [Chthoniobacteraceae bacterium]